MDSTKRIFRFQKRDLIKSVGIFWLVIFQINIISYILTSKLGSNVRIGLSVSDNNLLSMAGSNMVTIFIFFMVYGIVMYHESFALALSFGITRKDFYKSVIVNNFMVAMIFAIIQGLLQLMDKNIVESLGFNPMMEFGIFNTSKDIIFIIILALFALFLIFGSISNLFGVLQYKFGYRLWIGLGIVGLLGLVVENNFHLTTSLFKVFTGIYHWLESIFNNLAILPLGLFVMAVTYSLGFLIIRKIDIKK